MSCSRLVNEVCDITQPTSGNYRELSVHVLTFEINLDSNMARDSFKTFIPLSVENAARQQIIFDFFSLIAAVAAHGKNNGFSGRKLSRMASWWTFEHNDTGNGFDGGYGSWLRYDKFLKLSMRCRYRIMLTALLVLPMLLAISFSRICDRFLPNKTLQESPCCPGRFKSFSRRPNTLRRGRSCLW